MNFWSIGSVTKSNKILWTGLKIHPWEQDLGWSQFIWDFTSFITGSSTSRENSQVSDKLRYLVITTRPQNMGKVSLPRNTPLGLGFLTHPSLSPSTSTLLELTEFCTPTIRAVQNCLWGWEWKVRTGRDQMSV